MQTKSSLWRWCYLAGAAALPFALMARFIVVTREVVSVPEWADWLGWGGAIALGTICVWRLPLPWKIRTALTCLYVPVVGFLLIDFGLEFIGTRYGKWP